MAEHVATTRRIDDVLFVACGLAWGAGLIHVEAAIEHIQEYALYAVFFALLAPAQFAWGAVLYRRPDRRLLAIGAVMSLVVVALWVVSRTTGLPIGPTPWEPEAVGPVDVIATADEVFLALLAFFYLRPRAGAAGRLTGRFVIGAGVCLILASSMTIVLRGHVH